MGLYTSVVEIGGVTPGHRLLSADAHRHRPPAGRKDPAAYVLENFTAAERAEVPSICEQAADAIELLVALGLKPGQNTVHAW